MTTQEAIFKITKNQSKNSLIKFNSQLDNTFMKEFQSHSISPTNNKKKMFKALNHTHILDPSPSGLNLYDDSYLQTDSKAQLQTMSPANNNNQRFVGHKTALSQMKPPQFTEESFDQKMLAPQDIEVTNNSNLPIKFADAKLIFLKDWKREKDLMVQERSKELLARIQKKLKQSTQLREQIMIEDVQMKARATLGGDGNYLKKLMSAKKTEKEIEDRQSKLYMKQILERKNEDQATKEAKKRYMEEELQQRYEENLEKEYI